MAIEKLNDVLQGIVLSCPNKGLNNNYMLKPDGKILTVAGKDVHLWNDAMFHAPADQFFCFQPFNELVTHEESPSLSLLRRMINTELNSLMMTVIPAVIEASMNIKTPNKRQRAILGDELAEIPPAVVQFIKPLFENVKLSHRSRSIVDISLYHSHPITREADGHKYAALKSPLLQELAYWTTGNKVFDVKKVPTKKTVEILRHVLRQILPAEWDQAMYFVSNRHTTIPHNKALHDLYSDVLDRIAEVVDTLKLKVDVPTIHEDWTNGLQSIAKLMQGVPRDIHGTLGAVKAGVDADQAKKSSNRIVITEGFGATPAATGVTPTGLPMGGLLGNMNQPQPMMGILSPMVQQAPPGFMIVPVGHNPNALVAGAHGQPGAASGPSNGLLAALSNGNN